MTADEKLPACRPLDITPSRGADGRLAFVLRDGLQISPRPLVLSWGAYLVVMHLDGAHSVADIQAAFREYVDDELPAEDIRRLVGVLDHYLMLATTRFAEAYAARRDAYLAAAFRDNRDQCPDADVVREEIEALLGGQRPDPVPGVVGLIAPHLDYARGKPCYAAAHTLLAQAPPADRYVILGTNHFGISNAVVGSTRDWQTPLGQVATDRAFIKRLEHRLGTGICEHEFDHRWEHSVDLQVHLLQVHQAQRSLSIVPILCPDICGPSGTAPADGNGPDAADFADALGAEVAADSTRTVLIASADLSHVGQHFGDEGPATPKFLAEVERHDRRLLEFLEADDAEGFVGTARATGNHTRICSVGSLYVLRRALAGRTCRLLCYHQALGAATDGHVTCAAAVFCEAQ